MREICVGPLVGGRSGSLPGVADSRQQAPGPSRQAAGGGDSWKVAGGLRGGENGVWGMGYGIREDSPDRAPGISHRRRPGSDTRDWVVSRDGVGPRPRARVRMGPGPVRVVAPWWVVGGGWSSPFGSARPSRRICRERVSAVSESCRQRWLKALSKWWGLLSEVAGSGRRMLLLQLWSEVREPPVGGGPARAPGLTVGVVADNVGVPSLALRLTE